MWAAKHIKEAVSIKTREKEMRCLEATTRYHALLNEDNNSIENNNGENDRYALRSSEYSDCTINQCKLNYHRVHIMKNTHSINNNVL